MTERSTKGLSLDTLAIHAGQPPDPSSGAVMTPIVLSSTFAQESPGKHTGFEYSRSGNPTRQALESCLAAIEGGTHGFAFASGLVASTTLFHTLSPGDHILAGDDLYGGTFRLLDKIMKPLGLRTTFVDMSNLDTVRKNIEERTRMIWLESPTNPMLKLADIAKIAQMGKDAGARLVVDNTFATPVWQQPLGLGAAAVLHSTTKYINGHSDVVGGAVITADPELAEQVLFLQNALGGVPGPFDCYMVLRGLKTLGVRVRQATATAQTLATRLSNHRAVERVYYPGLPDHPGHSLVGPDAQMKGPGAMISLVLAGGLSSARTALERMRIFACAESLGGVESLAEHPAIMTHASVPPETRKILGIDDGLIRLSVGIEAEADLWADLEQALDNC